MKNRKSIKIFYLIISIALIIFAFISKPFIECGNKDINIYRKTLLIFSGIMFIPNIINLSKIKKKGIINFTILIIGVASSIFVYNGHSNDYKIRNELYFKSIFKIDNKISNNSVVVNSDVDNSFNSSNDINLEGNLLKVNYIDVGQGDSIFIELPNQQTMLIDAGERNQDKKVISYIDNLGYSKIDYVVGTHPHTDHIGGLESIIKKYDIGKIYMPKKSSNSKTFVSLLNAIKDKNLKINTAKSGVDIINEDNLDVSLIAPTKEYNDSNNSSAVVKITYINRCFLFMGDAEIESERSITDNIECDVVKIGHHGSDTSSSDTFVKKTKARYAVISVGKNNIYKHPYESTIKKWESIGAEVLRTDELGDIVISTNGTDISINNKLVNVKDDISDTEDKSNIEIIESQVRRGESFIKIKGEPNKEYDIKLYLKSGISKAKGLESKTSDSEGYVSWNFKLSNNIKSGKYKYTINDTEFEYEIK